MLLQALADVHQTTAHRDIKPDNILLVVDDEGKLQVKLIDWGSSQSIAAGEPTT